MINKIFLEIIAYLFLFLIPGYFIYRLLEIKKRFSWVDQILFIAPLSLFYNYYFYLLLNFLHIPINQRNLISASFLLIPVSLLIKRPRLSKKAIRNFAALIYSKFKDYQTWFFLAILIFALLPRIIFLLNNLFPYATDMSHHIYYARYIIQFGKIPDYPHPQYVVGEHIFLSFVPLFSEREILSYIPVLSLLIINLLTCFSLYRLSFYVSNSPFIASSTFFLSSFWLLFDRAQLGYLSGGVVGNVLGFFLIANSALLTILLFKNNSSLLFPSLLASLLVLAYSHTLSAVLAFLIFLFAFIFYIVFNYGQFVKTVLRILSHKKTLVLFLTMLTIFGLYFPNYFLSERSRNRLTLSPPSDLSASLSKIKENLLIGSFPFVFYLLSFIGIILLIKEKKAKLKSLILLAWFSIPLIYTIEPSFFLFRFPPHRAINYLYYPLLVLFSLSLMAIKKIKKQHFLIFLIPILIITSLVASVGLVKEKLILSGYQEKKLNEEAFKYLGKIIKKGENVFTDHVRSGIADDAIKNYLPFENQVYARTYGFRYEAGLSLDTLKMMEEPIEYLYLYKNKDIAYIVLKNNENRYAKIATNSAYFYKIFENPRVTIYKVASNNLE